MQSTSSTSTMVNLVDNNTSSNGSVYQLYNYDLPDNDASWRHVIVEDFKQSMFTHNEPTTIALMVLYVPIFLTSLMGNILVLLVIVPHQRMWTVTNNFLVNLAVADLLVTVLCMPMTLAGKVYKLWIYGDAMCKMTPYLQGVSVAASTFTITAMSLDRCLAILYPVKFRNLRTKRNVRSLIAIIWFTAILLMIPLLIVNKTTSQEIFSNFKIISCSEDWTDITQRRVYDFTLLFVVCLIPAQIVFVSYLLMGKRLWVTDARLKDNEGQKRSSSEVKKQRSSSERGSIYAVRASRRKTAKMCIVVSVVFVVCWLPYYTVNIHMDFKRDEELLDVVYWGLFIGHLHCITNPILYCFMHKSFRYGAVRILPCWKSSMLRSPSGFRRNGSLYRDSGSFRVTRAASVRYPTRETRETWEPATVPSAPNTPTSGTVSGSVSTQNTPLLNDTSDKRRQLVTRENYTISDKCKTSDKSDKLTSSKQTTSQPRKVQLILTRLRHGKRSNESFKLEDVKDIEQAQVDKHADGITVTDQKSKSTN